MILLIHRDLLFFAISSSDSGQYTLKQTKIIVKIKISFPMEQTLKIFMYSTLAECNLLINPVAL